MTTHQQARADLARHLAARGVDPKVLDRHAVTVRSSPRPQADEPETVHAPPAVPMTPVPVQTRNKFSGPSGAELLAHEFRTRLGLEVDPDRLERLAETARSQAKRHSEAVIESALEAARAVKRAREALDLERWDLRRRSTVHTRAASLDAQRHYDAAVAGLKEACCHDQALEAALLARVAG